MPKKDQSPNNEQPAAPGPLDFLGTEKLLKDMVAKRTPAEIRALLVALCVKKLAARGVAATDRLITRLRQWVLKGSKGEFRTKDSRGQTITLKPADFTGADARSVGNKLERRIALLYEKGVLASVKVAHKALRPIYDHAWPEQSRHLVQVRDGFEQRLQGSYGAAFELFAMQLVLTRELGDSINQVAREKWQTGEMAQLVDALSRLHARACQIGYEIAALLRAGYPEGAMARWRSLHEVSVVFEFIRANGTETAIRYLAHDAIESWKAAKGYNAMAKRLKHQPFTNEELAAIKSAHDAALATYGPAFESEYGWAAKALNNQRPNFAEIERAVELDHFRPYYKFASHNVHANPKGILYRLSVNGDRSILPTGPSNVGLTEPGQNAALAIGRITVGFAHFAESIDAMCMASMLNELPGEIGSAFWAAEKAIKSDEEKIQRVSKNTRGK